VLFEYGQLRLGNHKLDLIFSDTSFAIHGVSYEGFPILLDAEMDRNTNLNITGHKSKLFTFHLSLFEVHILLQNHSEYYLKKELKFMWLHGSLSLKCFMRKT
jgi:hypothetical protein